MQATAFGVPAVRQRPANASTTKARNRNSRYSSRYSCARSLPIYKEAEKENGCARAFSSASAKVAASRCMAACVSCKGLDASFCLRKLHDMSYMLILHLVLLVAIGAAMGLITRYYHPGPTPLDAIWSIISGVIGAAIVTLLGAYIGLYDLGGFMYYATAPTGALIGVMVYAVIITKE